jgi:hypothetical protein
LPFRERSKQDTDGIVTATEWHCGTG